MHVFHFQIYICAVFRLIAMISAPYSPKVTWYICAEFAAFTFSGSKSVGLWVFGQAVVTVLYPNGLTVWVAI